MSVTILVGDCRDVLRTLPDESVHMVVTSPPYWGLRDYGVAASIWGGDDACEHEWGLALKANGRGHPGDKSTLVGPQTAQYAKEATEQGSFCHHCGAWRGAHGLEPDYALFVENEVRIFREVRRVLRSDGTLWLNLGDSYCSGGRATWRSGASENKGQDVLNDMPRPAQPVDLKSKDLIGIPWRVAFALQADGWYLRQDIIWSKPNPMPESVRDRCTKAHEYLFLLSKSERYHFDQEAILEDCSTNTHARLSQDVQAQIGSDRVPGKTNGAMKAVLRKQDSTNGSAVPGAAEHSGLHRAGMPRGGRESWKGSTFDGPRDLAVRPDTGRKRAEAGSGIKNNDSFDAAMAIMPLKRNRRSVWEVTTQPFSEAHFATFPPALIQPCILAGTSEKGCCAKCGAPWIRKLGDVSVAPDLTQRTTAHYNTAERYGVNNGGNGGLDKLAVKMRSGIRKGTLGWSPSCECDAAVVPCVVLDPFGGAGTTGLVADRLGRNAILIELNGSYAIMAAERIKKDAGMFSTVEIFPGDARCISTLPSSDKIGTALPDCPDHEILNSDKEPCDGR